MKKILSLLLFLPLVALVTSCSDEDGKSIPDVNIQLQVDNAVASDGVIYVAQGNDLVVSGIKVVNNEEGKAAMVTAASYYFDYEFLGTTNVMPYGITIPITEAVETGKHILEVQCPVFAVDKEPAQAYLQYTVEVVASEDELPTEGTTTLTSTAKTVQAK